MTAVSPSSRHLQITQRTTTSLRQTSVWRATDTHGPCTRRVCIASPLLAFACARPARLCTFSHIGAVVAHHVSSQSTTTHRLVPPSRAASPSRLPPPPLAAPLQHHERAVRMVAPTAWHTSSAVDCQSRRARACPSLAAAKQSLERGAPVDDHDPLITVGGSEDLAAARPEEEEGTHSFFLFVAVKFWPLTADHFFCIATV